MGTGKTLISLQLLSAFVNKGMNTFYVAKSSYIKEAYEKKLTKDIPDYQKLRSLFLGSGQFYKDSNLNEFDCLIVDEAHRLTKQTKQSYMFYGNNQIQEIIHAAKNSVFSSMRIKASTSRIMEQSKILKQLQKPNTQL